MPNFFSREINLSSFTLLLINLSETIVLEALWVMIYHGFVEFGRFLSLLAGGEDLLLLWISGELVSLLKTHLFSKIE